VSPVATILASVGLVIAAIYALRMFQAAFHGAPRETWKIADLSVVETSVLFLMIALLVLLGVFPQPVLRLVEHAVSGVLALVSTGGAA
jgi:NADH-quinone oxidoreductase subunit M